EWLLFIAELRESVREYDIRNSTDLSHANCFECEILLHPGAIFLLDDCNSVSELGNMHLIHVYRSILGPFAVIAGEFARAGSNRLTLEFCPDYEPPTISGCIVSSTKRLLETRGYRLLSPSEFLVPVEYVSLEYTHENAVTVFHCLFNEMIDIDLLSKCYT